MRAHIIKSVTQRIVLALFCLLMAVSLYAQNVDTALLKVQPLPSIQLRPLHMPKRDMSFGLSMHETIIFPQIPRYIQSDFKHLLLPSLSLPLFGNHFQNDLLRGGSMVGLQYRTSFSDKLHLSVTPFLSNTYLKYVPTYNSLNAAINTQFVVELNDYIQLIVVGQYSSYHGDDFGYNSLMGIGTYYGGYIQVRIAELMYLRAGVERRYVQGKWVTTYTGGFVNYVRKKSKYSER